MDDGSASILCSTPLRVPVSELGRLAACPSTQPTSIAPVCSAPLLPRGPCPVCPRLEQEFEPYRLAGYWKAMHARALDREAQLKAENDQLKALLRLREQQLFGRKSETTAATAPRLPTRPDRARGRHGHAGSSVASRGRDAGIILTSRRSPRIMSFRRISAGARGVVNPSPTSRAPRIPKSWRSRSGPIAESSVGVVIGPPAAVVLIPAWSPPRRRLG